MELFETKMEQHIYKELRALRFFLNPPYEAKI